MADPKLIHYPESAFGGYTSVDGTVAFLLRARSLLTPESIVLDIGCGRGGGKVTEPVELRRTLYNLRGACAKVIGLDPNPGAGVSPLLDEFRLLSDLNHWPVEDGSIDVAIGDYVLEHVEDVEVFFSECRRVLKPGGALCLRTPNALSYFGIVSRLIPNRFHARTAARLQPGRVEMDVFPTYYRCNTRGRIRRAFRRHGFEGCVIGTESEPSYFSSSRILYALAVLHQKLAPQMFKITLLAFARKAGGPGAS